MVVLLLSAAAALAIAGHTQLQLLWLGARIATIVMILAGTAMGLLFVAYLGGPPLLDLAVFVLGFGLAHLPAWIVLWLKRLRGEIRGPASSSPRGRPPDA